MLDQPKIYVFTRAYNAEKTIRRAVESVLRQTYQNITYVIRDNGSTDSTYAICKAYAQKDDRIVLIRNAQNNLYISDEEVQGLKLEQGLRYGTALGENDFFCLLDADDEYMPDFFERAVRFSQEADLDIVVGGSELIQEETGEKTGDRTAPQDYCIFGSRFSKYFSQYHWYMRQVWGKLFRRNVLLGEQEYVLDFWKKELGEKAAAGLPYGADTICVLYNFQQAKRVGILSGCQHRWYIQNKSVSKNLVPNRIEADSILHKAALNFLAEKGGAPINAQNRLFLQRCYADAIAETVNLIHNSDLSPVEKLRRYHTIAANPLTQAACRECAGMEAVVRSRFNLLNAAILAGAALEGQDDGDLRAVMQVVSPHSGQIVSARNLPLFLADGELLEALCEDAPEAILQKLFLYVEQDKDTEKYAIPAAIQTLAVERPLLCQISDGDFLKRYAQIYLMVWRKETFEALEEMTGMLLENQVADGEETFLQLYISLAALENQAAAFIFGKFQLAWFLLRQGRKEECRTAVEELTELGVEGEELSALRQQLHRAGSAG